MRYFAICAALCSVMLCGCHESMEQRAQREAREFTKKYCPTPVQNNFRTDSVAFEMDTKTYHYYCSAVGDLDNVKVFDIHREKIAEILLTNIRESTSFRPYMKEGFAFQWTLRSDKDNKKVYFDRRYTPKDYNK